MKSHMHWSWLANSCVMKLITQNSVNGCIQYPYSHQHSRMLRSFSRAMHIRPITKKYQILTCYVSVNSLNRSHVLWTFAGHTILCSSYYTIWNKNAESQTECKQLTISHSFWYIISLTHYQFITNEIEPCKPWSFFMVSQFNNYNYYWLVMCSIMS